MNALVSKNTNIFPRKIITGTTNSIFLTQASNPYYPQELQIGIYTATNTSKEI